MRPDPILVDEGLKDGLIMKLFDCADSMYEAAYIAAQSPYGIKLLINRVNDMSFETYAAFETELVANGVHTQDFKGPVTEFITTRGPSKRVVKGYYKDLRFFSVTNIVQSTSVSPESLHHLLGSVSTRRTKAYRQKTQWTVPQGTVHCVSVRLIKTSNAAQIPPSQSSQRHTPLFLPDKFAPVLKSIHFQLPRLHSGKALLVLSAVILEHLIPALAFRPQCNGAHILAGAVLLVKGAPAVLYRNK